MIPVRLGIQRPFRYHDTDIASQRKPVIKNLRFHTSLDLLSFYYLRVVQLFSDGKYLGTLTGSATWIERSCTWISASIPCMAQKNRGDICIKPNVLTAWSDECFNTWQPAILTMRILFWA